MDKVQLSIDANNFHDFGGIYYPKTTDALDQQFVDPNIFVQQLESANP